MSTDRLHISSSDLDVERLMHEIRQNVSSRTSESLPQPSNGAQTVADNGSLKLQPPFQTNRDNKYHINDLLKFHGEDFVRNAFRALLLRDPDDAGMAEHLQSLASGRFNKIDVLSSLHYSPEGQRSGVTVAGLSLPATIRRFGRVPLLGYLIRLIIAVLRLPSSVQYQNRFEQYSLSLQQRIVDHQNQNKTHVNNSLSRLATEMLETAQTLTKQQHAIELSLRQHEELANRYNDLVKTLETRFDEARRYVDDSTARIATQTLELRDHQQVLSNRQQSEKQELLGQQQQLRSEIDEQVQQLVLRQQRTHDELAAQEARLRLLLEEVSRNGNTIQDSSLAQIAADESDHLLDGFYASFEDQFRGERQEVRRRLQVYVPILKEARITCDVVDIGCGRGEWLELLESEGIKAQGVDRNRIFVEECRRAGLTVIEADALTHLRNLPSESLNALTSFHLVEHMRFEALINLLDEMVRTLRHGGLLILETPNPENLLVGGCNFYADPTHRRPIPSQTLQFLLESRGLHDIKILKLRPWDEARIEGDSEIVRRFNDMFYCAPDYGIIATRT